jgi:predicted Zn finger-like uncharacterized protein
MDSGTIRATCPNCHAALRIPAAWAGHVVKCKKCGSGVRTVAPVPATPQPQPVFSLDDAEQPDSEKQVYQEGGDDFADLGPARASRDNPFEGPEHAAPPPGYHPGYYPPPGYPYPLPPGYSYPVPPGYGAMPPAGYPYPMPPSYPAPAAPAAYEPPPAYQPPAPVYQAPPPPPAPAFTPPAGPSAVAQAVAGFKPSEALATHATRRGGYRRGPDHAKYIWIGVALLLTCGLVAGGIYGVKQIKKNEHANNGNHPTNGNGEPKGGNSGTPGVTPKSINPLANSGNFPRRLLFIHISNYLYLNPLTHAQVDGKIIGPDLTKPAANRLAAELRVPNDQTFLLSDTAPGADQRAPMREVLTGTYDRFFETSRNQDRIVVYYGGHVLTKDGKTYLVPIEGDPDDAEKLVPVDDFYAKMKACKATQKIVIWDVARYNPDRGRNRPGSEPLAEETAKALGSPPPGVQAILTCQPGENALEFYNIQPDGFGRDKLPVIGSNFLAAVRYVSDKNRNNVKPQNPDDAIAVDEWMTMVARRANEVVAAEGKGKQTVKVAGAAPSSLVAFNKDEPPATKFDFPPSPKSAAPGEVADIATELNLPSIKTDDGESGIGQFPFPAEALAPYKADVPLKEITENKEKYPLRVAVIDAYNTIREVWTSKTGAEGIREVFMGKTTEDAKKQILAEQLFPAKALTKLEGMLIVLDAVAPLRANETKRWQAHYDYVLAQTKARVAWLHEYNLALGSIRTESLPTLDEKKGQNGYRLVASEKMKVKKEGKLAEEAKALYEQIITDYKGSPWAIQAKRDRSVSLGLAWQPAVFGGEPSN